MVHWALERPERLAPHVRSALRDETNDIVVSVISPWEVAIGVALGRLSVDADLELEIANAGFRELPVRFQHAATLSGLPPLHRDPFDRMLVAQAQHEGLTLVTRDEQVRAYPVASLEA